MELCFGPFRTMLIFVENVGISTAARGPLNVVHRKAFEGGAVPRRGPRAPGTEAVRSPPAGTDRIARTAPRGRPRGPSRVDSRTRSGRASGAGRGREGPPLREAVPRRFRGGPNGGHQRPRPGPEARAVAQAGGPWRGLPRAPRPPPPATDTR